MSETTDFNKLQDSRKAGDPVDLTPYIWPPLFMYTTAAERLSWGISEDRSMQINLARFADHMTIHRESDKADVIAQAVREAERKAFRSGFLAVCIAEPDVSADDGVKRTWRFDGIAAADLEPEAYAAWLADAHAAPTLREVEETK